MHPGQCQPLYTIHPGALIHKFSSAQMRMQAWEILVTLLTSKGQGWLRLLGRPEIAEFLLNVQGRCWRGKVVGEGGGGGGVGGREDDLVQLIQQLALYRKP